MWRRICGAAALVAGLAACDGAALLPTAEAPVQMSLMGGAVTARGAEGFCIDPVSSRARTGFVVMASCAALNGEGALPFPNGVVTVQVGAADTASVSADPAAFASFVQSEAGAAALGGPLGDVQQGDGLVRGRFAQSPIAVPGLQDRGARGFLDIGGRLVTVAVRGLAENPLSDALAQSLLQATVAAFRQANPPGDA